MREILARSGRVLLDSWEVLRKQLQVLWARTDKVWPWLDRRWPWLGRHRIITISAINSVSIVVLACIFAGVILRSSTAEATGHHAGVDGDSQGDAAWRGPAHAQPRAPARTQAQRPATGARIGQREYEVEVRRQVKTPRVNPGVRYQEAAPPPPEDTIIERSDEFAPDDPRRQRD
jgi:hypothetical protein